MQDLQQVLKDRQYLEKPMGKAREIFPWPQRAGQTWNSLTHSVLKSVYLVELPNYFRT